LFGAAVPFLFSSGNRMKSSSAWRLIEGDRFLHAADAELLPIRLRDVMCGHLRNGPANIAII
jgi:hypothetical protein